MVCPDLARKFSNNCSTTAQLSHLISSHLSLISHLKLSFLHFSFYLRTDPDQRFIFPVQTCEWYQPSPILCKKVNKHISQTVKLFLWYACIWKEDAPLLSVVLCLCVHSSSCGVQEYLNRTTGVHSFCLYVVKKHFKSTLKIPLRYLLYLLVFPSSLSLYLSHSMMVLALQLCDITSRLRTGAHGLADGDYDAFFRALGLF